MRNRHTNGLLLFCLIFIKAFLAADDIIRSDPVQARLGQSVSLSCKVKDEVHVALLEWTRCNDSSSIAVLPPRKKKQEQELHPHIKKPYLGHVSITEYYTLTINQLQDTDFGEYCCKVTTFPEGSLEGRVHLLKDESEKKDEGEPKSPPAGLPVMIIVFITCGVVGFLILTGIFVILLVCTKRRRKVQNPVHVMVTRSSLSPKQPSLLQKDSHTPSHTPSHTCNRDEEDDEDLYLNIKNSEP